MAQWWERSSSTNVSWVRFPDPASYVGWVCWCSTLLQEVFLRVVQFSPLLKNQHLIWLIWFAWFELTVFDLQSPQLVEYSCSAGMIWDLNKVIIIIILLLIISSFLQLYCQLIPAFSIFFLNYFQLFSSLFSILLFPNLVPRSFGGEADLGTSFFFWIIFRFPSFSNFILSHFQFFQIIRLLTVQYFCLLRGRLCSHAHLPGAGCIGDPGRDLAKQVIKFSQCCFRLPS